MRGVIDCFLSFRYTMPGKPRGGKRKMWKRKPRARRAPRSTVNVNRSLQPIPQRYICKLKYAEDVYTTATGAYAMNLNSLYDPNRTGTGHQPYGFDQLAALYNRYRVIACGWRLTAPSSVGTVQLGSLPANEVLTLATFAELKENPRARYAVQHVGGNVQIVSGKCYIPSLFGRSKAQYMADDRYQATVATDPAELAILNIQASNNGGVGLSGQIVNVIMEYTVEFFDVKPLGQS